jgi:hypothetical protein
VVLVARCPLLSVVEILVLEVRLRSLVGRRQLILLQAVLCLFRPVQAAALRVARAVSWRLRLVLVVR